METIIAFILGGTLGGLMMAIIAANKEDDDK